MALNLGFRGEMLRFLLLHPALVCSQEGFWLKISHFLSFFPSALERAGLNVAFNSWAYILSHSQISNPVQTA